MGGLLHLVQQGWAWAGCGTAQSPPRCTLPVTVLYVVRRYLSQIHVHRHLTYGQRAPRTLTAGVEFHVRVRNSERQFLVRVFTVP